ncbi:hypothetical protein PG987_005403 [Apiospora arundinis]
MHVITSAEGKCNISIHKLNNMVSLCYAGKNIAKTRMYCPWPPPLDSLLPENSLYISNDPLGPLHEKEVTPS